MGTEKQGPTRAPQADPADSWNQTRVAFDPGLRLGDLIMASLRTYGGHEALRFGTDSIDFRTLLQQVDAVASNLASLGVGPGDRVGVCAQRGFGMFQSILGVLVAGAAFVPVDPTLPTGRLEEIFEDARLGLLVGPEADLGLLDRGLVGGLHVRTIDSLLDGGEASRESPTAVRGEPDDLAYIFFTSGSTGRPKGAMNTHRAVVNRLLWGQTNWPIGPGHRFLQKTAFTFDVSVWEYLWPLTHGATLVIARPGGHRDPAYLARIIRDERIDLVHFVPSMLRMFLEVAEVAECADLKRVIAVGENLPADTVERFQERLPWARLCNFYGPTETAIEVTWYECDPRQPRNPVPIGRPMANTRIYILDPQGSPVPVGETGEIHIAGVQVGPGYFGRPDLTAERFLPDPFVPGERMYRSGDLGRWTPDGLIECLGRLDNQLKLRGNRIELEEIEARLRAHATVSDCVVGALDDPAGETRLVAWVVARDGATLEAGALLAFAASTLPDYMLPEFVLQVPELPRLSSGKTDRKALPGPDFGATSLHAAAPGHPVASADATAADATGVDAATARALVASHWRELLGNPQLDIDANLFDAGARSVLVMGFISRLQAAGINAIGVGDVYDHPSIRALQDRVSQGREGHVAEQRARRGGGPVAIVGMAVRAPGANDLEAFWKLLVSGDTGIRRFSPEELDPGVPESLRSRSNFVPCKGIVEDAEHFDAAYFDIAPREATLIDPQQRILLELAVQALEHAGIDPDRSPDIGVYAGTATASYLAALRQHAASLVEQSGEFATTVANDKDYVATRIAHRVGLRGPAIAIHTACSTGLVAAAMAVESLRSGQCDVALAGGATVIVPQRTGHLHVAGGMESGDGHCRPFESRASGTVFTGGAGLVVLKRLDDALHDGDTIYAVVEGIGVNNDGGHKASFTAPSVDGQARAIRRALGDADCSGAQIGYMEAHGTGTPLGDPIEVSGLVTAWERDGGENGRCALGSIKANVGHTIAAAGVLGLIRCALSLHREVIPAPPDFQAPNPQIDFANTPFRIPSANESWPRSGTPRRAAVSSFGVGGTNAHMVLCEAPEVAREPIRTDVTGPWLLPISAADESTLQRIGKALSRHLDAQPELPLDDVVHTLVRGRQARRWRTVVTGRSRADIIGLLAAPPTPVQAHTRPRVVLLFPGQGSQHPGMAAGLHRRFPEFARAFEDAWTTIAPHLDVDLRALLLEREHGEDAANLLAQTRHAQPALFLMGYALARWLAAQGLQPEAMIGHSIGEYAAVAAAGMLSLADAAACVCARGAAMQAQPAGSMLAARSDAATLAPLLPADVEVAARNAPTLTVLSGPDEAIESMQADLQARDIQCTRLRVSHAFHSRSMEGALDAVRRAWHGVAVQPGTCPVYSCLSGEVLDLEAARDPDYWARQVRQPVRFSDALRRELAQPSTVFVEVGPGQALTALVRAHREPGTAPPTCIPLLPSANVSNDASLHLLGALGHLWSRGVPVDLPVREDSRRATLPVYPFAGPRFWFDQAPGQVPRETTTPLPAPHRVLSASPLPSQETPVTSRLEHIQTEVLQLVANVSGLAPGDLKPDLPLVAQGLDSLSVTQAALELNRVFDTSFGLRDLLDRLDTAAAIAGELDARLPPERFRPQAARVPAPASVAVEVAAEAAAAAPPTTSTSPGHPPSSGVAPDAIHSLIRSHLSLIEQLLALLPGQPDGSAASPQPGYSAGQSPPAHATQHTPSAPHAPPAPGEHSVPRLTPVAPPRRDAEAEVVSTAPLAPGQKERWLAAALHENGLKALNESVCLDLSGPLDVDAMSRAVAAITRRHQAFSIAFDPVEPLQHVQPSSGLALEYVDVSGEDEAERAAGAVCDEAAATRFSLEHAPLARALLVRLTPDAHRLLVVASHLVFDGWSTSVIVDEIAEAYMAQVQSRPMRLPPAESSLEFAMHEHERAGTPGAQADIEWWKSHLASMPAPISFGDIDPEGMREFGADTVRCVVEGPRLERLKALCSKAGATLFQGTLASLACALGAAAGITRLVVGIPYAGQLGGAHPALITDGVYDMPLLIELGEHGDPAKMIGPLRATLLEAMDHARVTQGQVARALGVSASGMRPPLSGVYFNFNPRVRLPTLGEVRTDIHEARKGGLLGEAFFNFYDLGDRLRLELHYSTDYFSRERAEGLVEALMRVLDGDPAHMPAPRQAPHDEISAPWVVHGPTLAVPTDQRLDEFVLEHLAPDQEIICGEDHHDGRDLRQAVEALASVLRSKGIGRGCRVGIHLPRGFWMLAAPLGVMRTGACYVPMDPLFPEARLAMIAEDAALDLLITTQGNVEWAEGIPLLDPTQPFPELVERNEALPETGGSDSAGEPAYAIYTSGSTGRPKGVALSHRSVVNFLMTMRERPGLSANDTLAALTTLSFDIVVLELFLPLLVGARLVILQTTEPLEIIEAFEREHVTVMQATPPSWTGLIGEGWKGRADFRVFVGGEALAPDLARQLLERAGEVWNLYGPTETTVWSTLWKVQEPEAGIRVGRPVANTHIVLLDEQLNPCGLDQTGEICIGGAGVALGYLNRPELTAERFIADPSDPGSASRLYRTGDLGRWDAQGNLEHLGRTDHQIKIRGFRIEPGEIEVRLREHPDVDQAVVIAREFAPNDIRLVAYITPATRREPDVAAVRHHLAEWLPGYMRPQHVAVLPALPLTPNGKIDRLALPNPIGLPRHLEQEVVPRPDENLELVLGLAREMLGDPKVGGDDNFFDAGGHSLLALSLMVRIREKTGKRIHLLRLANSSLAAVASDLSEAATADLAPAGLVHRVRRIFRQKDKGSAET